MNKKQSNPPYKNFGTNIEQTHKNISYKVFTPGCGININEAVQFKKLETGNKRVSSFDNVPIDDGAYEVSGESLLYEAVD